MHALSQSSNIQNIDILAVGLYHLCHCSIQYEIVRGQQDVKICFREKSEPCAGPISLRFLQPSSEQSF